ncbi:MAG TPA: hypothetical protein VML19_09670, partial [Verrucomicrobiae bacterium]|nr:hypothetical protein [Verrucomicrobiae bacterium]
SQKLWSPSALDTAAFVDLSIRRCRGRLAAIPFGAGLYLAEIVFCLGWLDRNGYAPQRSLVRWLLFGSVAIDVVWLCTAVLSVLAVWYRRKKRAELSWLLRLQQQIGNH